MVAANDAYAALAAMPESQASGGRFELSRLDHRPARARPERVKAFAERPPEADRYWWDYPNGGLDETGLVWLRARVQR